MQQTPYLFPHYQLQVFSKVPELGKVKTRMQPRLPQEFSLELHRQLVRYCLYQWSRQRLLPVNLWLAGDLQQFDREFKQYSSLPKQEQQGENLGKRMALAVETALNQSQQQAVILVGTDCPFIDSAYLEKACQQLQHHDAVIGPAHDGGYVLLGLKVFRKEIFEGIEWGGDSVFAATIDKLQQAGMTYTKLPDLSDIDHPEDLALLSKLDAFSDLLAPIL